MGDHRQESLDYLDKLTQELEDDTENDVGLIIMLVSRSESTVRMVGINLDEEEMASIMEESTEMLNSVSDSRMTNRTLN